MPPQLRKVQMKTEHFNHTVNFKKWKTVGIVMNHFDFTAMIIIE